MPWAANLVPGSGEGHHPFRNGGNAPHFRPGHRGAARIVRAGGKSVPIRRKFFAGITLAAAVALAAGAAGPDAPSGASEAGTPDQVRALIAADRWREALEAARGYAAAHPDDRDAVAALGEALYRAGRIDEAGGILEDPATAPDPPARLLAALGLVRTAQGRGEAAGALLDRALALAPGDRWVVYHAASAAPSRAESIARLERYLALSDGDDPDRIEGARGTIRTNRALGERRVWIPVARPDRVEAPLKAIADGSGGVAGYVVEAEIAAGRKTWLLLDSGSGGLFMVERALKKASPETLAEETVFAGGGSGRDASRRAILPSFALRGLSFQDALITTTRREIEPTGRYHGVLGLSIFEGYRVTIDLARGRLVLERDAEPIDGAPYFEVAGQMLVEATAGETPGLFLLDTGAARSVVSAALAETIPGARLGPATPVHTYGGAVSGARLASGIALAFQTLPSHVKPKTASDLTQRSRLGGVEVAGFVGLDVLAGHLIVVDTVRRKVRGRVSP